MITAVILAGGYGTRLKKLTKTIPKPMIVIAGKPVIRHIIDNLHIAGINQIIVKTHYLPEVIMKYLGNSVMYYYESELLSHKETIIALQGQINDNFFVINGDTLSNVDYRKMLKTHKENTITVLMDEWRCAGTWLYSRQYFKDQSIAVYPYRQTGLLWFDIGTPERLQAAKDYYERYEKN